MKRKLAVVLLIIIFFTNIANVTPVYADITMSSSALDSLMEDGTVTLYSSSGAEQETVASSSENQGDASAGTIASVLVLLPRAIHSILDLLINVGNTGSKRVFSIQNTVFNNYDIFSINFFSSEANENTFNASISTSAAQWFYVCRNISLVILLGMLIYVGIRMAMSTVAAQRAKYKKMLIGWGESIVLLFLLQYIFIILVTLSENILDVLKPLMQSLNNDIIAGTTFDSSITSIDRNFETKLITGIKESALTQKGFNVLWPVLEYYVLVFYQIKFFIMYVMRKLRVAFLIMIAPLITVTYSADKVGDNRAQAFGAWTKEFVFQVFIQDLHAVMYLVFVLSAASIATKVPTLAIVFLIALSNSERIVKRTFNMEGKGLQDTFGFKNLTKKHFK